MDDACKRFFDTAELLDLLTSLLAPVDISALIRTNRRMYKDCSPSLYKTLLVDVMSGKEWAILTSIPCMLGFGRNIHHVRTLHVGPVELAYLYNCFIASETTQSLLLDTPATVSPLPQWLPPTDRHSRKVMPLPPMTNLRNLELSELPSLFQRYPMVDKAYKLSGADNPQAITAQFCWIIFLNPRLTQLEVEYDPIVNVLGSQLFVKAVSGLSQLTMLSVSVYHKNDLLHQMLWDLFFVCSPSLRIFRAYLLDGYGDTDAGIQADGGSGNKDNDVMNSQWYQDALVEATSRTGEIRRQEPLTNLEELDLWDFGESTSTEDILAIIAQCPNIKTFEIATLSKKHDPDVIGEFIGTECPRIYILYLAYGDHGLEVDGALLFRIMNTLPPQQVEEVYFNGSVAAIASVNSNFSRSLLRHSTTLRMVYISWTGLTARISLAAILEQCVNLVDLFLLSSREPGRELFTTLADLLERPWNTHKLSHLSLAVSGCGIPNYAGKQLYHARPLPIVLSDVERVHFGRLEELYRRIGSLSDISLVNVHLAVGENEGEEEMRSIEEVKYYTNMIQAGRETGLPDFWRFFRGRRQMRVSGPFLRL